METGEDYSTRDLLDQVARLIEIFGVIGTAEIVGCPAREVRRDAAAKIRLRDDECA